MADTYSTNLKVRLPATGAYNNSWGTVLNADTLSLLDQAITGRASINMGSTVTYSLAALAPGAAAESRAFALLFTGSLGSAGTVTLPGSVGTKFYLIDNQTGQSLTFTYAASTNTVVVANGNRRLIWADGSDCYAVFASASDADTLDGIDSTGFARSARTTAEIAAVTYLTNTFGAKIRNASAWQTVTEAPTTTIDSRDGNNQILTLTGNRTMAAPTNVTDGQEITLMVVQDGTGGRTLTWNSVFEFENGASPVLASTAASIDLFKMIYNSALAKWIVGRFGLISAAGGSSYNFAITENTIDWNLLAKCGTLGGAITANVTINQGVIVQATGAGTPALDLSGLPAGSTVNLFNSGYVLGRGGNGGDGGVYATDSYQQDETVVYGDNGGDGGNAILGPGAGRTFNITNASGCIWGGGGGGGGGGFDSALNVDSSAAGGGGGGGAGGGAPGRGRGGHHNPATVMHAANGTWGSSGPNGIKGSGGAGASSGLTGYAGGDGGDFGVAASVGGGPAATYGALGAAGKAIELSGAGAPTWISGSGSPNVLGAVS